MELIKINANNFDTWSEQISKLIDESFKKNFDNFVKNENYSKNRIEDISNYLKQGTAIIYAAICGKELVGWIWFHEIKRFDSLRLHIAEIAVSEKHQKKGIGKMLIEQAENYAKDNNYMEIELLVTKSNSDAVSFYESNLFETERLVLKKKVTNGRSI